MLIKVLSLKFKLSLRIFITTVLFSLLLPMFLFNFSGNIDLAFAAPPPSKPKLISPPHLTWINDDPIIFKAEVNHPGGLDTHALFNWAKVGTNPDPPADADGDVVSPPFPVNSIWIESPDIPDGIYDWRAKAIDSDGVESSFSTETWRVMKDTENPTASCFGLSVSENRISFNFNSTDPEPAINVTPSGVAAGDLQRSVQGGSGSGAWITVSTAKNGTYSELGETGFSYNYRFRVTDNAGNISLGGPYTGCGGVTLTKAWLKANGGDVGAVGKINPSKSISKILELQVLGPLDDAHQKDGGAGFTNSTVQLQMDSNISDPQRWNTGLRFNGVTINKDVPIVSATLRLLVTSNNEEDPNIDIYAENVDNAVDFDLANPDVNNRALTSSVSWVDNGLFTGDYVSSPDIKSVIQEVINRVGWVNGNSLVLLLKGKSDVNKEFWAQSFESGRLTAKLIIEYDDRDVSNTDYLVIANKSISRFTSARDWLVENYDASGTTMNIGFSGDIYTYLWEEYGKGKATTSATNGEIPSGTGIYAYPDIDQTITGDFDYSNTPITGMNEEVVLFINGNMNVNFRINLPADKRVVYVVKNNITFNIGVGNISPTEGFFIAGGEFNTGTNFVTPPQPATDVGQFTSIALRSNDIWPVMAYYDEDNGDLKIGRCSFNVLCSSHPSSTVDRDPVNNVGLYTSLALDPITEFPMISYFDNGDGTCSSSGECRLKFAICNDVDCIGEDEAITVVHQLIGSKIVGKYTSIAVGRDGLPIISYWNEDKGSLWVAKCTGDGDGDGIICNETGDWVKNEIDDGGAAGTVGKDTSIVICTDDHCLDNNPMISYYDYTGSGDLKFAKCNNESCTTGAVISFVDSGGLKGEFNDIAVCNFIDVCAGDTLPIISYYDEANFRLKTAKCIGDVDGDLINCNSVVDWTYSTIEDDDPAYIDHVGLHNSIAIDPNSGLPAIAYQYVRTGICDTPGKCFVKVAECADTACTASDLVTYADKPTGNLGFWTDIVIRPVHPVDSQYPNPTPLTGYPQVSFYDDINEDILLVLKHGRSRHLPCGGALRTNCIIIDGAPEGGNCPTCGLKINGAVITGEGVLLGRTLGIANQSSPAFEIDYDPSYLYFFARGSPNGLLAKQDRIFRELPP